MAVLLAAIGAMFVATTSASAITEPVTFTNWAVWGSLTPKKLNEPVVLPKGSTFNGTSEITITPTEFSGTLSGNILVPPFQASLKLLGLIPTTVGVTFTQVGAADGTLTTAPAADCSNPRFGIACAKLTVDTKANLGITAAGILGIEIPTQCETSEPATFNLSAYLPIGELVLQEAGPHFTGTTTIPSISCDGGLLGLPLSALLSALMSGPENPYALNLGPNEPAAPTVATQEASSVSQISADLHATVDPNGEAESDCHFEYGTSTSYGTSAPCSWRVGAGFAVYAPLTGLSENTTYHVRAVSTNTLGTSYGADQTFTTLSGSPEYGQCVAQKDGNYADGNCQTVAEKKGVPDHKGKYEWVPGPAATCVAQKKGEYTNSSCTTKSVKARKGTYEKTPGPVFTSTTGPVTLETAALGVSQVTCAASTATGEVTGTSTGTERITLTGCEASGKKCTSEGPNGTPSGKAGTIVTNLLRTRLLGPVSGQVWIELASSEHEPYLAEFGCEGKLYRTRGSLSGVQSGDVNVSSLTSTTRFSVEEGKEAEQALFTALSETGGKSWSAAESSTAVMLASNTAGTNVEIKP
ncbi:MAG: hypothetical protein ABSB69_01020 [Solirubrobacteraceae bacterium]